MNGFDPPRPPGWVSILMQSAGQALTHA